MNPKDKAKELIDKYKDVRWDIDPETAKQGALIAVDEIIQAIRHTEAKRDLGYVGYWNEVKIEIEKL